MWIEPTLNNVIQLLAFFVFMLFVVWAVVDGWEKP